MSEAKQGGGERREILRSIVNLHHQGFLHSYEIHGDGTVKVYLEEECPVAFNMEKTTPQGIRKLFQY